MEAFLAVFMTVGGLVTIIVLSIAYLQKHEPPKDPDE